MITASASFITDEELRAAGVPFEVARLSRGYVLLDAKGRVVTDGHGKPYTYAFESGARKALAARGVTVNLRDR